MQVRGNRISNAAFSAVRGNAASISKSSAIPATQIGEVALYAEFGFQGVMIANNIVDGAALGISVTNFDQGGRLAGVQGNLIRNLVARRPAGTDPHDGAGIGIGVEADTVVSGNVVENAPNIGIAAGWGQYLRDVTVNANVVRGANYGIAVSVAPGAGAAVIADNMISDAQIAAIIGMEWNKPVTGDLARMARRNTRNFDRRQSRTVGRSSLTGGATTASCCPARSRPLRTKPFAFNSSTKVRRYCKPASWPSGTPIASLISWK